MVYLLVALAAASIQTSSVPKEELCLRSFERTFNHLNVKRVHSLRLEKNAIIIEVTKGDAIKFPAVSLNLKTQDGLKLFRANNSNHPALGMKVTNKGVSAYGMIASDWKGSGCISMFWTE